MRAPIYSRLTVARFPALTLAILALAALLVAPPAAAWAQDFDGSGDAPPMELPPPPPTPPATCVDCDEPAPAPPPAPVYTPRAPVYVPRQATTPAQPQYVPNTQTQYVQSFDQALAALNNKDYQGALTLFQQLLASGYNTPELNANIAIAEGSIALQNGDDATALTYYKKAAGYFH